MATTQQLINQQFRIDFNIIEVLACVLTELCDKQSSNPKPSRNKFSAQNIPGITLYQYLTRIDKYSQCSKECFILALIYIDRIIQANPTFLVNYYNIHRLLITAVMLAAKFFDDQYYNNTYYARVGGVEAPEMNQLEVEFLFMNNFFLSVPTDTYFEYFQELRSHNQDNCANCQKQKVEREMAQRQRDEQAQQAQQQQQQQSTQDQQSTTEHPSSTQTEQTQTQQSSHEHHHHQQQQQQQQHSPTRTAINHEPATQQPIPTNSHQQYQTHNIPVPHSQVTPAMVD